MKSPYTSLPHAAGIGLRAPHVRQVLDALPPVAWFEVHAENYFGGGANLTALQRLRAHYPVSLHGVGLGLGSACAIDAWHLARLAQLCDHIDPAAVSEHLCWNRIDSECLNDLLPLPYSQASLDWMCSQVHAVQEALGRKLLIENLTAYVAFGDDVIPEGEFLAALAQRTGCGLLLDVNNLCVNEHNLGRDARATLRALPIDAVAEIHIAGFEPRDDGLWIDSHGAPVCDEVWQLLDEALHRFGAQPVLLERDCNLPPLSALMAEAALAQKRLDELAVCI